MKAVVGTTYGPAEALQLADVETPVPAAGEVLARVRAASVNAGDWRLMRGEPLLARPLMGGLRGPKPPVRGWDFAGVVEAVGPGVTDFRPGDEVFGRTSGAFADLTAPDADRLAPKPPDMSFEAAAALPVAGITALQALRDRADVRPGQRVLVNGAAGGVGTFAVQIAKALGAEVTAVCSARNAAQAAELGADRVIDYALVDFTRDGVRYDVVLDNVGSRSLRALRRALTPRGTLVLVGGGKGRLLGPFRLLGAVAVANRFSRRRLLTFLAKPNRADLLELAALVDAGKVRPVIDRTYPLAEAPEAIAYVETGHARGKVIVVP
jgi:NADPH:quinone reductase-like Zn-dependent oxidoreductase